MVSRNSPLVLEQGHDDILTDTEERFSAERSGFYPEDQRAVAMNNLPCQTRSRIDNRIRVDWQRVGGEVRCSLLRRHAIAVTNAFDQVAVSPIAMLAAIDIEASRS